jgi:hypothetical protein
VEVFAQKSAHPARARPLADDIRYSGRGCDGLTALLTRGQLPGRTGEIRHQAVGCASTDAKLGDEVARVDDDDASRLAEEQERHLLYVGCTCAGETLLITYSRMVSPYLTYCR